MLLDWTEARGHLRLPPPDGHLLLRTFQVEGGRQRRGDL